MKCPKCGNTKMFLVAVSSTASYDAENDDLYDLEDSVIDDRETATCAVCDHAGPYEEFEPKEKQNGNQTK